MTGLYSLLHRPSVVGVRELNDYWHLPTADLDHLVAWEPCRFIAPPQCAFLPPDAAPKPRIPGAIPAPDDHWLPLGDGERPDGTFAPIGLLLRDLLTGMIISAPPGTGKTHLGKIILDGVIRAGAGFSLIDFKNDFVQDMLRDRIPREREATTWVVDLADTAWPVAINPFVQPHATDRGMIADSILTLISRFDPGFAEGVRMIEFTRNASLALLEAAERDPTQPPDLLRLHRFMRSAEYRKALVTAHVRDPLVREFWLEDFPNRSAAEHAGIDPVIRRLGIFLMHPVIRNVVCQPRTTLDFRAAMDHGHSVLAALPVEVIGPQIGAFAAVMLQELLTTAAFSRSTDNLNVSLRTTFVNVLDEFHTAVQRTDPATFANQISKGRAMGLATVLLYQASAQLPPDLLAQMESTMTNLVCLGALGGDVANLLRRWGTALTAEDLMGMRRREDIYLQLQVDEQRIGVFRARARALPPPPPQPPLGARPANPDWTRIRARETAPWHGWMDERYGELVQYAHAATAARDEARQLRSHAALLDRGERHAAAEQRDEWERARRTWPRDAADQRCRAAELEQQAAQWEQAPHDLLLAAPAPIFQRYVERAAEHRQVQRAWIMAHPAAIPNAAERIVTLSRLALAAPALEVGATIARTVRDLAGSVPEARTPQARTTVAPGAVMNGDAAQPRLAGLAPSGSASDASEEDTMRTATPLPPFVASLDRTAQTPDLGSVD